MSELEKSFIELREANSKYSIEVLELRQEVARLREALEFYADKNNWSYVNQYNKTLMKDDHDFNVNFSDKFGGKRAREALERSEG